MESAETHKKNASETLLKQFPRKHLVAAGSLAVTLTVLLALFPSEEVAAKRHEMPIELNLAPEPTPPEAAETLLPEAPPSPPLTEKTITVKSGDNLSRLFQRAGLNDRDVYELTSKSQEAKALKRIHPGHQLVFGIDANSKLQQLSYIEDRMHSTVFIRQNEEFKAEKVVRSPDVQAAYRKASIDSSLFLAGQQAGMESSLIMELANIFGWDIDFALDIRQGDHFQVLYEEEFLDGEKIGNGAILAAEFTNQGKTFKAVRYTDAKGNSHYYTPEGRSMRKAFLRAPLDFRRISSNFNPRRLHPIYKTVRPHRGTDYAASRGTPVYASGSGRVVTSGYNKANGNYVVIQHTNNIQTKYLHLHKRKVRKGQKVSQKQLIGTVGSTGYSTAPHLHYEFVVNGVHRNPRTILQKLPKAKSVPKAELNRFQEQTQPILTQLDGYQQNTQLALADSKSTVSQ